MRQNPEVGPDDRTGMIPFVYAGTSPIQGKEIYQNAIASFTSGRWSFEPLNPPLGDEAVVGRKSFGTDETGRESESVLIYFRVGPLVGAVEWDDYSDLPNRRRSAWPRPSTRTWSRT